MNELKIKKKIKSEKQANFNKTEEIGIFYEKEINFYKIKICFTF